MTINDKSSLGSVLKTIYAENVTDVTNDDNPFLALLPKKNNQTGGDGPHIPVKITLGEGGGSATLATAITYEQPIKYVNWLLTMVEDNQVAGLSIEAYLSAKKNLNSFIDISKELMSTKLKAMANNTAISLYGKGSGVRARIASSPALGSSTSLVLADPTLVYRFDLGMPCQVSTLDTGASMLTSVKTITSIDPETGTLTFDSAFDSVGGQEWLANHYLYRAGDQALTLTGLDGWLPATIASSGDSHFSVNRYISKERLGGVKFDGRGMPAATAIYKAAARVSAAGPGKANKCFVSFDRFASIVDNLNGQFVQNDFKVGKVGFSSVKINGPRGQIDLIPDRNCPNNLGYLLDMDTWALYSKTAEPFILNTLDGNVMRLDSSINKFVFRFYSLYQLGCTAPGYNARILFA